MFNSNAERKNKSHNLYTSVSSRKWWITHSTYYCMTIKFIGIYDHMNVCQKYFLLFEIKLITSFLHNRGINWIEIVKTLWIENNISCTMTMHFLGYHVLIAIEFTVCTCGKSTLKGNILCCLFFVMMQICLQIIFYVHCQFF